MRNGHHRGLRGALQVARIPRLASLSTMPLPRMQPGTGLTMPFVPRLKLTPLIVTALATCPTVARAEVPYAASVHAYEQFNREVARANAARDEGEVTYLWLAENAQRLEAVGRGEVLIEKLDHDADMRGAMLHSWIGGMFVPNIAIGDIISVFLDHGRYPEIYPGVIQSKLISGEDGVYKIWQRLQRNKIVLDTWHEAGYRQISTRRASTWSNATEIREVRNPGEPGEQMVPTGQDSGYMWRLSIYWRLEQREDGVLAECHSMTLTRDIPWLFRWLLRPLIDRVPRNALRQTLEGTAREARKTAAARESTR